MHLLVAYLLVLAFLFSLFYFPITTCLLIGTLLSLSLLTAHYPRKIGNLIVVTRQLLFDKYRLFGTPVTRRVDRALWFRTYGSLALGCMFPVLDAIWICSEPTPKNSDDMYHFMTQLRRYSSMLHHWKPTEVEEKMTPDRMEVMRYEHGNASWTAVACGEGITIEIESAPGVALSSYTWKRTGEFIHKDTRWGHPRTQVELKDFYDFRAKIYRIIDSYS